MTLGQVKQAVKGVTFDIIPKYNKVNSAGTIIQDNLGSLTDNKLFYCFFSNISSLSKHAQEYLLSLPHEIALIATVENHKDTEFVESKFHNCGFNTSYSAPLPLPTGGTHGGELLAIKSRYQSKCIPKHILEHIVREYGDLRFAARIVEFHNVDVLFITVYLWCNEGFSVRNNMILYQILMLKHLLHLPLIGFGDFNITFHDFQKSGWAERLRVNLIHPGLDSTLASCANRPIDFGFISYEVDTMKEWVKPITSVPWAPHFGFMVALSMKPREATALVLSIPKKLPIDIFQREWAVLESAQKAAAINKASKRSKSI